MPLPPLAERMRPQTLDEVIGQEHVIGPDMPLRVLAQQGQLPSMIFWGPPGCGKTTIARLLAQQAQAHFEELSAVSAGTADVRRIIKEAKERGDATQQKTILFLDEVHRFSKSQQDALLPAVEKGIVTFIGATTENPSFEVNPALRSRARIYVLHLLTDEQVRAALERAMRDTTRGLGGQGGVIEGAAFQELVSLSQGDIRQALGALELAFLSAPKTAKGTRRVTREHVQRALQRTQMMYDKDGEEHYNVISALHKAMRGSDVNASLYWLARMLEGGEDPLYIARRLIRFASEDIGMADPQALVQAVAVQQASHMIGMPECNVVLSQAVVYLAQAPKSNKLYAAYNAVKHDVHARPQLPVPLHIRNAPTQLMKDLDYGKGYIYPPDVDGKVQQSYLPDELQSAKYWEDGKSVF